MELPIQTYLANLHQRLVAMNEGELASYIPELTRAHPDWFGVCIVTMDGYAYSVGDATQLFTIQSVSKPFVYAQALADRGVNEVMARVGVEPSGDAFNSISLHPQTGAPRNPMINAGAIASTSLVSGATPEEQWQRIRAMLSAFAGRTLEVDESVYRSESETGYRNRAIAWMLRNFNITEGDPMPSLENYFRQCSLLVDCRDLAFMAATLANGGLHPLTGQRCMPAEYVDRVLSVMATCGMYDYAGSWLYEVGMPAKSGVGGGILAVLPGRFGIGVFSPRLDDKGNSARGIAACKQIALDFGLNIFNHSNLPALTVRRMYNAAMSPSHRQTGRASVAYLREHADRIKVLCLQGEMGVDSAEYVIRRLQDLAPATDSFILDLHLVANLSRGAASLLHQARRELYKAGITVVLSRIHGRKAIEEVLSKTTSDKTLGFLCFEGNDIAVQWCENRMLEGFTDEEEIECCYADSGFFAGISAPVMVRVCALMQMRHFAAGEVILDAGQVSDGKIYFIERGRVNVLAPSKSGNPQFVATLGPGMNFGEFALLGQRTRTALVHAESETRCRVLAVEDLNTLARELPDLKIAILENLSLDLAEKLKNATHMISILAN